MPIGSISSRGLREGLALGDPSMPVPSARLVRTISVATLAARFATWDARAAERRSSLAAQLIEALDPDATPELTELLAHAAFLLDVGKAIDYYERYEHAAMIVMTADLAGFPHRSLGILSAILRYAGGDGSLGPSARLIATEERPAVRLAGSPRARRGAPSADPRDEPPAVRCRRGRRFEVEAPVPASWDPRGLADRFRAVFRSGSRSSRRRRRVRRPPSSTPTDRVRLRGERRSGAAHGNVVPSPSSLSTSIVPPWFSTTCFTIARPSPVPPVSRDRAVHAVEALEDARDVARGDADACRSPQGTSAPIGSTSTVTLPPSWL